jgi:uncharacterized membrane protein
MNKRISCAVGFAAAAVLLILSCTKDIGKPVAVATPPPPPGHCDTINYNEDIKIIIDQNCISCHAPGQIEASVPLTNYTQVKAQADAGRIKARVIDGNPSFMPQGSQLSADQKQLIQCWLDNGEKEAQ